MVKIKRKEVDKIMKPSDRNMPMIRGNPYDLWAEMDHASWAPVNHRRLYGQREAGSPDLERNLRHDQSRPVPLVAVSRRAAGR